MIHIYIYIYTYIHVYIHIYMYVYTHTQIFTHTHAFFRVNEYTSPAYHRDMGWLRIVGSLKLQVSIGEYSLFYRALLQKRPKISRRLLIIASP